MKTISKGIVFSNDIKKILEGANALNYRYDYIPSNKVIEEVRQNFKEQVESIFDTVTIISEDEMNEINRMIEGRYPHRLFG